VPRLAESLPASLSCLIWLVLSSCWIILLVLAWVPTDHVYNTAVHTCTLGPTACVHPPTQGSTHTHGSARATEHEHTHRWANACSDSHMHTHMCFLAHAGACTQSRFLWAVS
jgi:hypothetical protein